MKDARSLMRSAPLAAALLAPVLVPAVAPDPGGAQQTVIVRARVESAGWLGLGVIPAQGGIVVSQVVEDGPAARAGLRPRDRIVRVDGARASPALFTRVASTLEPGRRMKLTVERDGERRRELVVVAGEHPASSVVLLSREMAARVDSKLQRLDSLRATLARSDGRVGGVLTLGQVRGVPAHVVNSLVDSRSFRFESGDEGGVLSFFRSSPSGSAASVPGFFEVRRGEGRRGEAPRVVAGPEGRVEVRVAEEARPLLPHIEGQDRVGGARLTVLNEELATYFEVERGLLVTEVIDGTPMARAGVRPGDVVVAVGGRGADGIGVVRNALWHPGPVVLSLVRRGEPLEVRLAR